MPLIFQATGTQTMAASDLLGVGECSSTLKPYISPTAAATIIQMAYRCYIARRVTQQRASRPHYDHRVTQVLDAMPSLPTTITAMEAQFETMFSNLHNSFLSNISTFQSELDFLLKSSVTSPLVEVVDPG